MGNEMRYSASFILAKWQVISIIVLFGTLLVVALLDLEACIITVITISNILYTHCIVLKSYLFCRGVFVRKKLHAAALDRKMDNIADLELPVYSIMFPMYKEGRLIPSIVQNASNINYPRHKLQILLIIESDDYEALNTINSMKLDSCFELIKVPPSYPRTKSKACNYALSYLKGEYCVVYDADDIPNSDQLLSALRYFRDSTKSNLCCVQAGLGYYNWRTNWLTAMFEIEYIILFQFILPSLAHHSFPIPLGGSSNHFVTKVIKEIGGWDPYNVTEDAEIGLRLKDHGYDIEVLSDRTLEEAPTSVKSWLKQRARWIKGHLHTYLIYMRSPLKTKRAFGVGGLNVISNMLGVATLTMVITPILIVILLLYYCGVIKFHYRMAQVNYICGIMIFIVGMLSILLMSGIAVFQSRIFYEYYKIQRYRHLKMLSLSILFPLYLIFHMIASYIAIYELISEPHHWNKTKHIGKV